MRGKKIGLLHPGSMGATVGSAAIAAGHEVLWASESRSQATLDRAARAELRDVMNSRQLTLESEVIISICPPDSALSVARDTMGHEFRGIYVDANAVAPESARKIGTIVEAGGASFVDGGIIGPPALRDGTTRLHLSGQCAQEIEVLFDGSMLGTSVVNSLPGSASALKMCYAAHTKGTAALAIAIRALAAAENVEAALLAEWDISQPGLSESSEQTARRVAPRAWRFAGEMKEIADTFEARGLPGDFHRGARTVYQALGGFKDSPGNPSLESVIEALLAGTHAA